MGVSCWVAFSILLAVAAGCQSAPPVPPVHASETSDLSPGWNSGSRASAELTLARFEEPLTFSVPPRPPLDVDQQGPATLGDLEEIAVWNNPTLAAAAARMEAARGRQVQAGLYPNPVIGYHSTEVGNDGTAGAQGGFVSQRFVTGGKRSLDQAVAGREVTARHFEFHAQEQRVLNDVRVRFYEAFVAQRRVDLVEDLVEIAENLVRATETLLEGRQASPNDLLQAEIQAEDARILRDNARNESMETWRRLAAVIGAPHLALRPLDGELNAELPPPVEWNASYGTLLANNPELNAARTRSELARIALLRARREPIPDIDLFVSVRHQNVTKSDVANVQAGIPLPIFDRNQGSIHAFEADWIASEKEVQRIELELQDRFAVTFRRYVNARHQVERYGQKIVPKAERSLKLVTQGYEMGQVEYLTLLTAQRTYLHVTLSYLDALRELHVSSTITEGQLLIDSLAARPEGGLSGR